MAKRCGVEITDGELRYVVLDGTERRPRLLCHGRIPLDETESACSVTQREGEVSCLARAIAMMRREAGVSQVPTRVALGTQSSILRVLSLPPMPKADLERVVQGEADKERKILGEELSHGFRILPAARGEKKRTALLALSSREGIEEAEEAAAWSGRLPESLTTSSLAVLAVAAGIARASGSREPSALLHLGSDRMILTVTEGEGFRQFRDLGLGMNASLLQERAATGTDGPVQEMDWDRLDQIGRGRQTLDVDQRQRPDSPVTRLVLAGDATRAGAMAPLLENELGLPVTVLDPLENLDCPGNDGNLRPQAASLVLPIALARSANREGLLHLGRRHGRPAAKGHIVAASALICAALAMTWVQGLHQERTARLRAELASITLAASGHDITHAGGHGWMERSDWAQVSRTTAASPLTWLSATLPDGMSLAEADIRRGQDSWRIDFRAQVTHPERLAAWFSRLDAASQAGPGDEAAGAGGPEAVMGSGRPPARPADAALLAWPALRAVWAFDPAVLDLVIAPPLGIVARTRAPEYVSGTVHLRGEP